MFSLLLFPQWNFTMSWWLTWQWTLSLIPGRRGGRVTAPMYSRKDHMHRGWLHWCSWRMSVPACATGSKEDTVPSRRCLRSKDTLETIVVRYGERSWSEADSGLFSAGHQWCTGFWSSQISSLNDCQRRIKSTDYNGAVYVRNLSFAFHFLYIENVVACCRKIFKSRLNFPQDIVIDYEVGTVCIFVDNSDVSILSPLQQVKHVLSVAVIYCKFYDPLWRI